MRNRSRYVLAGLATWLLVLALTSQGYAQANAATPPPTAKGAWEYGPFVNGGIGTSDRSDITFFWIGVHAGKVLTPPAGPGILKGQLEYAVEVMPLWQSYTPAPHLEDVIYVANGGTYHESVPVSGGTFTGVSVTPIILRWNFKGTQKVVPFMQGAGGVIWTNHKYPPDFQVPQGLPGGTSVFNFTPQFGVGLHYFVKPKQSISFGANAVHISSASLGDKNPGINASVQLQLGYTWWK
jgi:lipid A 3-O-deacylase